MDRVPVNLFIPTEFLNNIKPGLLFGFYRLSTENSNPFCNINITALLPFDTIQDKTAAERLVQEHVESEPSIRYLGKLILPTRSDEENDFVVDHFDSIPADIALNLLVKNAQGCSGLKDLFKIQLTKNYFWNCFATVPESDCSSITLIYYNLQNLIDSRYLTRLNCDINR